MLHLSVVKKSITTNYLFLQRKVVYLGVVDVFTPLFYLKLRMSYTFLVKSYLISKSIHQSRRPENLSNTMAFWYLEDLLLRYKNVEIQTHLTSLPCVFRYLYFLSQFLNWNGLNLKVTNFLTSFTFHQARTTECGH